MLYNLIKLGLSQNRGKIMDTVKIIIDNQLSPHTGTIYHAGQWLTVLESKEWWCDEPLSFGKLDGQDGYLYNWVCRSATPAEILKAKANQEQQLKVKTEEHNKQKQNAEKLDLEYRSKLTELIQQKDRLVTNLIQTNKSPILKPFNLIQEVVGSICPEGRGVSHEIELRKWVDDKGVIVAVSYGEPCGDMGVSYWVSEEIKEASDSQYRVSQWWKPGIYNADSYPGPGVAVEDLTREELNQVQVYEAAKRAELIRLQIVGWKSWIEWGRGGSVELENNIVIVTVPKSVLTEAQAEAKKLDSLNTDKRSNNYNRYPLPVELRACGELAVIRNSWNRIEIKLPSSKPSIELKRRLTEAGFRGKKEIWFSPICEAAKEFAQQLVIELNAKN